MWKYCRAWSLCYDFHTPGSQCQGTNDNGLKIISVFFMTILIFYSNSIFSHIEIISLWLCSRPSNCPRPPSSQYFEVSLLLWILTMRFLALLPTYEKIQHLRPNSVSKVKHIYWRRKMFQTHIGNRILVTWKCPALIPKEKTMILDKPYGYIVPTFYITKRPLAQGLYH